MNKVRIFLADDHCVLREGLKYVIKSNPDYEIIGESGDGKDTLEKIEKLKPDIVLLDISMPTMTGIEVARQIRKYIPGTRVIIFSRHDNEEYIHQVMKYGVKAYILKDDTSEDVLKAIKEVLKGNIFLSGSISTKIVSDFFTAQKYTRNKKKNSIFDILSNREIEILKLITEGKPTAKIALNLRISENTVKAHRANIMKKLNVHKVTNLVKYAIRSGLVE
ncbi:MAG: response regulator transcription factor [Spirochaetota bacterium]